MGAYKILHPLGNNSLKTPKPRGALVWPHNMSHLGGGSILRDPNITCLLGAHPKIQVVTDVFEEAPDHGSQVDDMGGLVPFKQGFGLRGTPGVRNFGVQWGQTEQTGGFPSANPRGQLTSSRRLWRTQRSTPRPAAPLHQPPPSQWLFPPNRCHPSPGCAWSPVPLPPLWPKPCGVTWGHLGVHLAMDH